MSKLIKLVIIGVVVYGIMQVLLVVIAALTTFFLLG